VGFGMMFVGGPGGCVFAGGRRAVAAVGFGGSFGSLGGCSLESKPRPGVCPPAACLWPECPSFSASPSLPLFPMATAVTAGLSLRFGENTP
jgi:hypothetical protein